MEVIRLFFSVNIISKLRYCCLAKKAIYETIHNKSILSFSVIHSCLDSVSIDL